MLALISLLACLLSTSAQDDPEYRMEVGGSLGLMNYMGDYNGNLLSNMQPMLALTAKYRYNPRQATAVSISYGKLKGSAKNVTTWYPEEELRKLSFDSQLMDVSLCYEYNFWPYGTGQEYLGARRVVPFITGGLGATYAHSTKGVLAANVPIGLGMKVKLGQRMNLTASWMMHFTGSDELDGVKDPYGIKSSGLFKNTDCYSTLLMTLTYDILAKCKTCNNDRE